jgi:hypothetical protein
VRHLRHGDREARNLGAVAVVVEEYLGLGDFQPARPPGNLVRDKAHVDEQYNRYAELIAAAS